MDLIDVLDPRLVFCDISSVSKNRVLRQAVQRIAGYEEIANKKIDADQIFDALITRERLGSTAIGRGVAIPHCTLPKSNTIVTALIKLHEPIDYDTLDGQKVDLLFILLAPMGSEVDEAHLTILSQLVLILSMPAYLTALRVAKSSEELYQAFTDVLIKHQVATHGDGVQKDIVSYQLNNSLSTVPSF